MAALSAAVLGNVADKRRRLQRVEPRPQPSGRPTFAKASARQAQLLLSAVTAANSDLRDLVRAQ
jgi:hypothetical protein